MKFKVPRILTERAREYRKKPTVAEEILWRQLRNRALGGYKFRRQQPIERFIVDFVCLDSNLVVEVDGDIHKSQGEYDKARDEYLEALGFKTIRFHNEQVLTELEAVKELIFEICNQNTPHPED